MNYESLELQNPVSKPLRYLNRY